MYILTKKRQYIYIGGFSVITIALLLFLKSVIASIVICYVFIKIFLRSKFTKFFVYCTVALLFVVVAFSGKPLVEDIRYKYSLYFGPTSEKIPRNALYIASFQIAKDYFPFGSGQGTFGSLPVGRHYSKIYYDYNLNTIHGLSPADALGKTDSHFIFDTHWSSVLGELGFIGALLLMTLWVYPALKSYRYLSSSNIEFKALAFFITMSTISIFIESIGAPIPNQLQFIMLYAGLGGVAFRLLTNTSKEVAA